jgi:hypothetical protein
MVEVAQSYEMVRNFNNFKAFVTFAMKKFSLNSLMLVRKSFFDYAYVSPMTVTDLLQVVPLKLFVTSCYELVVINLLRSDDIRLVGTTCCQSFVWPHQPCYKMITTCSKLVNDWEQAVRTHLVDKLRDFHPCTTHVKTHKLLQICSQAVDKLSSHCLFPVVVTSLKQAVNNL